MKWPIPIDFDDTMLMYTSWKSGLLISVKLIYTIYWLPYSVANLYQIKDLPHYADEWK